jgi:signal transduction histidine kinase
MTHLHLLGVPKVRRSLLVPILAFTTFTAARHISYFGSDWPWMLPLYAVFDGLLWIGAAFLIFAVIERRQTRPPQPRFVAMAAATIGLATLSAAILSTRALFQSFVYQQSFVSVWLRYLPGAFYTATFYLAIVTGIGYAVYSWAVDDRRLAEAAELDATIARAELKAASARLQPESLDAALARVSTLMATDVAGAQRLISDLGAQLHDSLGHPSR